uniref:Nucleolar protein 16 n=1 Tax=Lygus hesperus TaxID=30085 RepID=A0A0A9Y1N4_LYGHE
MKKYGDNYRGMQRDPKLNVYQMTETQLQKRIEALKILWERALNAAGEIPDTDDGEVQEGIHMHMYSGKKIVSNDPKCIDSIVPKSEFIKRRCLTGKVNLQAAAQPLPQQKISVPKADTGRELADIRLVQELVNPGGIIRKRITMAPGVQQVYKLITPTLVRNSIQISYKDTNGSSDDAISAVSKGSEVE